jgi:hypothetical protein
MIRYGVFLFGVIVLSVVQRASWTTNALVPVIRVSSLPTGSRSRRTTARPAESDTSREHAESKTKSKTPPPHGSSSSDIYTPQRAGEKYQQQARELLAKAQALRDQLPITSTSRTESRAQSNTSNLSLETTTQATIVSQSKWNVARPEDDSETDERDNYRLYLDLGREDGTWMDPRWGASGRRIEGSLDIQFRRNSHACPELAKHMVNDNLASPASASVVRSLATAPAMRLRQGFDAAACHGGAYRLDGLGEKMQTLRFLVLLDGVGVDDNRYGDVSIPSGCLYFSLPVFGPTANSRLFNNNNNHNNNNNPTAPLRLSAKEGIVSVRQIGWHTGWRRRESRIVGTFRAVPLVQARKRDGF